MEDRTGFGLRLGAAIIDAIVIVIGGGVLGALLGGALGAGAGALTADEVETGAAGGGALGALMGAGLGTYLVGLIWTIWEGLTGAALGKRVLNIRIKADDGSPADVDKLISRAAIKNIGLLCGLVSSLLGIQLIGSIGNLAAFVIFIGCFFVLGDKRQAFHDMIAKTAVYPTATAVTAESSTTDQ
jgi:uncharacterized RDD family membrane protein YckC